jgi:hypothetical protein
MENRTVLEDLVAQPELKDRNYQIVHYDSPDRRGVDVGLIYNPKYFKLTNSKTYHTIIPDDPEFITRDQLVAFALQAGANAVFDFQYATNSNDMLSGKCVITNLSESSNASDDATLTVDFRVVGAPTFDDDITNN